jgi:selenocysteine-specific elongation factor
MELQPGRLKVRIRGLQRHKTKVDRLEPGTRAAVNLSGIHAEDVRRGMVLALPGTLARVTVVDAHVRAASTLSHPLAHDAGVTFLSATSEAEGKIRLLDADDLDPGGEAWVQIVLESPVAVVRGDRCVIRTPNETVAGGVIVAVNPRRHRRHHALTIARLAQELEGSAVDRLADRLGAGPLTRGSVAPALGLEAAEADDAVREAVRGGLAVARGERLFGQLWLDSTAARIAGTARAFVAANPLRGAAPREHVRSTTTLSVADFEVAVSHAVEQGLIEERGREGIAPAGHRVTLSASQRGAADRFLASLRAGGFSPPTEGLAEPALLAYLADEGMVENTGAGVVFAAEVFAEMLEKTSEYITTHGGISLGEVRDLFGTSRKYAQAFLEHLDARRITRRVGDTRVLRAPVEAVQ